MALIKSEDGRTYTFDGENRTITLTANEMSLLFNQYAKLGLRDSIEYKLRELDGDTIDLAKAPNGFDDLVEEIYVDLEDEIDYGNMPSDDDIEDKVTDVCDYYDMCID